MMFTIKAFEDHQGAPAQMWTANAVRYTELDNGARVDFDEAGTGLSRTIAIRSAKNCEAVPEGEDVPNSYYNGVVVDNSEGTRVESWFF